MNLIAAIEIVALCVALVGVGALLAPRRRRRLGTPGAFLLAMLATAALLHLVDFLEWRGHATADRLGDILRIVLPVLWCALAFDCYQNHRAAESSRKIGQFRLLLQQASLPTILVDEDGVIVDCSDSFLFQSSCIREELVGRRLAAAQSLPRTVIDRAWRQAMESEGAIHSQRSESAVWAGDAIEVDWSAQRWIDQTTGRPAGASIVLYVLSTSESRQKEEDEAAATTISAPIPEIMAPSGRTDEQRAAAHDLANFLQIITGQAQVLAFDLDLQNRQAALSISQAGEAAYELVRALSGPAPNDSRKRLPIAIADLVRETIDLVTPTARPNQRIIFENDAPKAVVEGDRVKLQRVLVNLLRNALEAMARGGTVLVQLGIADCEARIRVVDEGEGIPDEVRDRIFDRYFTTKPPGEGTGLGLTVVREIVAEHGGSVHLGPKRAVGTEFVVELPLHVEQHVEY